MNVGAPAYLAVAFGSFGGGGLRLLTALKYLEAVGWAKESSTRSSGNWTRRRS
jgi:hypothetical protein